LYEISVSEVELGLQIDNEKFVSRFGFPKPKPRNDESEKPIVIYCMSGFRARKAQKIFEKFGFNSTKVYDGSFKDWTANGGEVEYYN
jgi:rhodanese-related sulfurtransferase